MTRRALSLIEPIPSPARAPVATSVWLPNTGLVDAVNSSAVMASKWHTYGMARIRLSTTVDASLLEAARGLHSGPTDAALVDDALRALLARNRAHEIDAGYTAYDENPADQPDEWGDLESWRRAASAS